MINYTHRNSLSFIPGFAIAALLTFASNAGAETVTVARAPEPVIAIAPEYPDELLRRDLTGEATVEFTIDAAGNVRDVVVISMTYPDFGRAARSAIRDWKFEPPFENGRSVSLRAEKRFNFRLDR